MVAPVIPRGLAPLFWLKAELPVDRECVALPVKSGELCFGVLIYSPPKRSKWRPRTVDCIPPLHVGKWNIFLPRRDLAFVIKDCREFNQRQLLRMKPGRTVSCWSVPVSMVCGFDETARVVEGGAL